MIWRERKIPPRRGVLDSPSPIRYYRSIVCTDACEPPESIIPIAGIVDLACLNAIVDNNSSEFTLIFFRVSAVVQARLYFARKEDASCRQGGDGELREHLVESPLVKSLDVEASMYVISQVSATLFL